MIRCFLILSNSIDYKFISEEDDMDRFVNYLSLDDENPDFEKADFLGWDCILPSIPQKGSYLLMNSFKEEMLHQWIYKLRKGDNSMKVFLQHLRMNEDEYEMLLKDEEGSPYSDEQVIKHVIMGPPHYIKDKNVQRVIDNRGVDCALTDGIFSVHYSEPSYDDKEGVICFIPNKNYVVISLIHQR